MSDANLSEFIGALERYAQDHDGRLPVHASGQALADEIESYLSYRGALSSPYGGGEVRVRVLLPGGSLADLREKGNQEARALRRARADGGAAEVRGELAKMPFAELVSDDGLVLVAYVEGGDIRSSSADDLAEDR